MKFKEYDTVKIIRNCGKGINKGEIGAIIMVFEETQAAYEVEILDVDGNTKVQSVFYPDDLELVNI